MTALPGEGLAVWLLLSAPIFALAAFLLPRYAVRVGLAAAGVITTLSLLAVAAASGLPLYQVAGGWAPPLGIALRLDGLSAVVIVLTAVTGLGISLHAAGYFSGDPVRQRRFWPLWLLLWGGMNALWLSADLFNLYVTLEIVGLASVALVALAGGAPALRAAMRYLLASLLGSLAWLLGTALLYGATGTLDLLLLAERVEPGAASSAALALMTAGLLLKTALFPLHFWLPPAHAGAPAPVSAALSALVVKTAFYLLLRLWFEIFPGRLDDMMATGFGLLGAAAVAWGSFAALRAVRLKLVVAWSTVAQVGYLFLVFPLAQAGDAALALRAAVCFLLAHGLAKAAMFLAAGNIQHGAGHDRVTRLRGAASAMPLSVFAFSAAGASLAGLPPSAGFTAKWLLLETAATGEAWGWAVLIVLGGLASAAYVFRVLHYAFAAMPREAHWHRPTRLAEGAALGLALLALLGGFAIQAPLAALGGMP